MNIEEENKLMLQAVRDIETICLGAQHTQPDDSVECHDLFVAALRGIAKIICDQAKQRIFDPPPVKGLAFANPPLEIANEKSANPKIGTLPAKFIHGDGFWTGFAVNSTNQTYCLDIKKRKHSVEATFLIDGDTRFELSSNSFRRTLKCALAASNAYIGENNKAKERRRRAKERCVSPSPAEKIGATVARQEGRAE